MCWRSLQAECPFCHQPTVSKLNEYGNAVTLFDSCQIWHHCHRGDFLELMEPLRTQTSRVMSSGVH